MILADSGFWLALANARDEFHELAKQASNRWANEGFVSTWPVVTESAYLIGVRVHHNQRLRFIQDLAQGSCEIRELGETALLRLHALMVKYRDLPMDLADASLVVLAEDLSEGRILSTDERDFRSYKWKNRKPFRNLLLQE